MRNHHFVIEAKSGGERRRAGLITPINGSSYCASKTHLRVEVDTSVMVVIMARNAHPHDVQGKELWEPDIEGRERGHVCD